MGKEYSFANEDGSPIYHRFELEREGNQIVVVLKSGSGATRKDGTPHNSQYNQGVERLIAVLSELKEPIERVVLDTNVTRGLGLTENERTLSMDYPILPWKHKPRDLRLDMGGIAQKIGQESGARGGNNQKQLRVYIRDINPELDFDEVEEVLSGTSVSKFSSRRLPIGLPPDGETIFTRSNSPEGWLYVVTNPKWPEWVKIGITRDLAKRLSSYNTGAPTTNVFYQRKYHKYHPKARDLEREIHKSMRDDSRRGDSREWYRMSIEDAVSIIDRRCE